MLPDDPQRPAPDQPSPGAPNLATTTDAATPPGYLAGPAPVPVGGRSPRRRWMLGIAITLVALLGGSGLFLSGYSLGQQQAGQPGTAAADVEAFQSFWDAYHDIADRFALGPVPAKTLVEGAIKGMVASINDPFSAYLSPEDYAASLQNISGQFEGIGTVIGTIDATGKTIDCTPLGPSCQMVVISDIAGAPAEKAGVKAGDIVDQVDGTALAGQTPDQARGLVRGPAGTSVTIHIIRAGVPAFNLVIVRAKIQQQEVVTKDLSNGTVGYVQLTGFSEAGADAFVAAVKNDVDRGIKKIIVDLRGNPGGFIDAAQKVASTFIGSGPIFWQEDQQGNDTETPATPGGVATDPSIKVVVLIDSGSASASEIVAGALRDTKRATLVGQTSYGKGTVQQWLQLENSDVLKLTIAKWLTPDKHWIHHIGILPDVVVTPPTNAPAGSDPVLDRAVAIITGAAVVPQALPKAA